MPVSCNCTFDKQYLCGLHGWLDCAKVILSAPVWIALLLTSYSGIFGFVLSMGLATCIGTLLWLAMLGLRARNHSEFLKTPTSLKTDFDHIYDYFLTA